MNTSLTEITRRGPEAPYTEVVFLVMRGQERVATMALYDEMMDDCTLGRVSSVVGKRYLIMIKIMFSSSTASQCPSAAPTRAVDYKPNPHYSQAPPLFQPLLVCSLQTLPQTSSSQDTQYPIPRIRTTVHFSSAAKSSCT
jgi:hypothetical protein